MSPGHLQEASWSDAEPPQLPPFSVEEYKLHSELHHARFRGSSFLLHVSAIPKVMDIFRVGIQPTAAVAICTSEHPLGTGFSTSNHALRGSTDSEHPETTVPSFQKGTFFSFYFQTLHFFITVFF